MLLWYLNTEKPPDSPGIAIKNINPVVWPRAAGIGRGGIGCVYSATRVPDNVICYVAMRNVRRVALFAKVFLAYRSRLGVGQNVCISVMYLHSNSIVWSNHVAVGTTYPCSRLTISQGMLTATNSTTPTFFLHPPTFSDPSSCPVRSKPVSQLSWTLKSGLREVFVFCSD